MCECMCCVALPCCLFDLACFFLPSFSSLITLCLSHPRQLIFLRKSDCLGCAVLLCRVVCLTLLASFFLPSHLSLNTDYIPLLLVKVPKGCILPIGLLEFHPADFRVNSTLIHIIIYI